MTKVAGVDHWHPPTHRAPLAGNTMPLGVLAHLTVPRARGQPSCHVALIVPGFGRVASSAPRPTQLLGPLSADHGTMPGQCPAAFGTPARMLPGSGSAEVYRYYRSTAPDINPRSTVTSARPAHPA